MRKIPKLALWLLISALVIGTAVFPASAAFYHPRGLLMSTYPQTVLVFWTPKDQSVQLIVIIMPPWYFVDGLYSFDTVTLTATLKPTNLLQADAEPMRLLGGSNSDAGSSVTTQWTNVVLSQDSNGAIVGAYLLYTITFVINQKTPTGFYLLYLSGQAAKGDVLFYGWTQIGVSLRPCGYCFLSP